MDGLFTDPNCSSSVAWSSWLGVLGSGGLDLGAFGAEVSSEGSKAQHVEDARKKGWGWSTEYWWRFD